MSERRDYEEDRPKPNVIREWTDEQLIRELRSPIRATLGPDAYHLLFAEALARLIRPVSKGASK